MVKDARGHEVPAGGDAWAYREDMEQLSRSINDVVPVASSEEREALISELAASEDGVPGIVLVQRADAVAGSEIEYTLDSGETWIPIVGNTAGQALTHIPAGAAADPPSKYPAGVSLMQLNAEAATSGAWPIQAKSQVHTIQGADGAGSIAQIQMLVGATSSRSEYRNGAGDAWAPWLAGSAPRMASGSLSFPSTDSGTANDQMVTFPYKLFTATPYVFVSTVTTAPHYRMVSASTVSTSSAVLRYYNNGPGAATVNVRWLAVQP